MAHLNSKSYQTIEELFMSNPGRFGPLGGYTAAIMDAEGELTRAEREEIALFTSGINGCKYCIGDHSAVLENLGVDTTRISAAADGSTKGTSEKMRPLLEFVAKLTRNSGSIEQGDFETLTRAGWSDQGIEDAICICSLFNLFNRLVTATGLQGTAESHARTGRSLSQGYA